MKQHKSSLLFELRPNGVDCVSYLFGTMHARSEEAFKYYKLAESYLEKCQIFSGEINLNEGVNDTEHFYFEEGRDISYFLSQKQFEKLSKKISKYYNLNLNDIKRFKPMIIQNMLLESSSSKSFAQPLDMQLKLKAEEWGMEITGVETFNEQKDIFNSIKMETQLKGLLKMASNIHKTNNNFKKLVKHYQAADHLALYSSTKRSLGSLRRPLLFDRNIIMADRIFEQVCSNNVFVAIGAAHMGGSKGVLRYLTKKGIKIRAIID